MGHLVTNRDRLLKRISRIRGQLNAVEKALVNGDSCATVLQPLVSCRGAMNGLLFEVIEGHIEHHIVDPRAKPNSERTQATRELIDVLQSYLK